MSRRMIEALETRTLFTTYLVNTLTDSVGGPTVDGLLSLREAITAANTNAAFGDAVAGKNNDRILFDSNIIGQTITLAGQELLITSKITFVGKVSSITIDAVNSSRALHINTAETVNINGVSVKQGTETNGGGIYIEGGGLTNIRFAEVLSSTASSGNGGGIYVAAGRLNFINSELTGNSASAGNGGALYVASGATVSFVNSRAQANFAATAGGAIANDGTFNSLRSEFSSNVAATGGGLASTSGVTSNRFLLVSGNSAGSGGGVQVSGGTAAFRRSRFQLNNASSGNGGGLLQFGASTSVTLIGTAVNDNTATGSGGGIAKGDGTLRLIASFVTGNDVTGSGTSAGGGIFNQAGEVRLNATRVTGNTVTAPTSARGGGIFNGGTLITGGVNISTNSATEGGGLFTDAAAISTLRGTRITANIPDDTAGTGTVN